MAIAINELIEEIYFVFFICGIASLSGNPLLPLLFFIIFFIQMSFYIQAMIDYWLQENYPTNWYVKHFCWWYKLYQDERCWELGYKIKWKN